MLGDRIYKYAELFAEAQKKKAEEQNSRLIPQDGVIEFTTKTHSRYKITYSGGLEIASDYVKGVASGVHRENASNQKEVTDPFGTSKDISFVFSNGRLFAAVTPEKVMLSTTIDSKVKICTENKKFELSIPNTEVKISSETERKEFIDSQLVVLGIIPNKAVSEPEIIGPAYSVESEEPSYGEEFETGPDFGGWDDMEL